jgi:hypothetical protein
MRRKISSLSRSRLRNAAYGPFCQQLFGHRGRQYLRRCIVEMVYFMQQRQHQLASTLLLPSKRLRQLFFQKPSPSRTNIDASKPNHPRSRDFLWDIHTCPSGVASELPLLDSSNRSTSWKLTCIRYNSSLHISNAKLSRTNIALLSRELGVFQSPCPDN